jgi:hypothetical protein
VHGSFLEYAIARDKREIEHELRKVEGDVMYKADGMDPAPLPRIGV